MKKKNNYWRGIPEELRFMCMANIHSTGRGYCTSVILDFLGDFMMECDSFVSGITPYDVIRSIDVAFETSLFPLETCGNEWKEHIHEIGNLLNRSEQLIEKVAPSDYRQGHRLPDLRGSFDIVGYYQRLTLYFCVYYSFTKEWEKFETRLEDLLMSTERNVSFMLTCMKSYEYTSCNEWTDEFHYVGTDAWEPLSWLGKEYIDSPYALTMLIKSYKKYLLFLGEYGNDKNNAEVMIIPEDPSCAHSLPPALEHLRINAEKHLYRLTSYLQDDVENALIEAMKKQRTSSTERESTNDSYKDYLKQKGLTSDEIMEAICNEYGISKADVCSKKRRAVLVKARQIFMYLCYKLTEIPFKDVANIIGISPEDVKNCTERMQELVLTEEKLWVEIYNINLRLNTDVRDNGSEEVL